MSESTPSAGSDTQPSGKVAELEHRLDALSNRLEAHDDELFSERQARQELEDELEAVREENAELRSEIEELRERTDLLKLVKDADTAGPRQRSVALLQHMRRAASRRQDVGERPRLAIDRDRAEEILHYPDIDRSTFYTDMERAERLVGDRDIVRYADGELVLDMDAGDPAERVDGVHKSGGDR